MKTLKINQLNKKALYVLCSVLLSISLFGCREKERELSLFEGLPESTILTEIKTSLENNKPAIVSFTAEWCPHCRNYKPIFFDVKNLYQDKATFINIDVDDTTGSALSTRFQVRGIPTTAFVRLDGSVYKVQVGEIDKENLIKTTDDLIKSKRKSSGEPVAPFPIEEIKSLPTKEHKNEQPQELIKEERLPGADRQSGAEPEQKIDKSQEESIDAPEQSEQNPAGSAPEEDTVPDENSEDSNSEN